jgi:hypothetical protein
MLRKGVLLAVFLLIVPTVGAQGIEKRQKPYSSIKEGTGLGNPPSVLKKKTDGEWGLKTSDGEARSGKSAGVVMVSSNTDENGGSLCIVVDESVTVFGTEFLQGTVQNLIFKPSPRRSSLLEIIWSGQVNVYSASEPTWGPFDQQAFFKCSVSQRGETVPCSGTAWIPTVAQDTTGAGITEWETYHGYVELNPKYEVTVEISVISGVDTDVVVCGDTLTLKY